MKKTALFIATLAILSACGGSSNDPAPSNNTVTPSSNGGSNANNSNTPANTPAASAQVTPSGSPASTPTSRPATSAGNSNGAANNSNYANNSAGGPANIAMPGATIVPSATPAISPNGSPAVTPSQSPVPSPNNPTVSPTASANPSISPAPSVTPAVTATHSPVAPPSNSPVPSATPSSSPVAPPTTSPAATPSSSPVAPPTNSPVATPSNVPTPSASPSATPTNHVTIINPNPRGPATSPTINGFAYKISGDKIQNVETINISGEDKQKVRVNGKEYDLSPEGINPGYTFKNSGTVSSLSAGAFVNGVDFSPNSQSGILQDGSDTYLFTQGKLTPENEVPVSGKAEYTGLATYTLNNNNLNGPVNASANPPKWDIHGSNFVADFDSKTLTGQILTTTNNSGNSTPVVSAEIEAQISGNTFSGEKAGTKSQGAFFGPKANEVGGIYVNEEKGFGGAFNARHDWKLTP